MSFLVSARKYRPQKFDDVVGQEHITKTLKNAILTGRVSHSYLFTGPRGVGKTTTARILAKVLNCINPQNAEACEECDTCKAMQEGRLMDIFEIDAASNRGIDEIRTIREAVKYSPTLGQYKVYIIDEVHMLTMDSFNAFLKTLEEPPDHAIFIFATTDIHKVPSTIISRCQRYDFRRIPLDVIKTLLSSIAAKEEVKIDDKTLTLIARKSDGGLRDAESFFDQTVSFCGKDVSYEAVIRLLNLVDGETYFSLVNAISNKDFATIFTIAGNVHKNGWDITDFLEGLIEHFRNLLSVKAIGDTSLVETAEVYRPMLTEQALLFGETDLLRLIAFVNRGLPELRFSGNRKIRFELILCQLAGIERTLTIAQLINKVEKGIIDSEELGVKGYAEKKKLINENQAEYKPAPVKNETFPAQKVDAPGSTPAPASEANAVSEQKVKFSPRKPAPQAAPIEESETTASGGTNEENFKRFIDIVRKERGVLMEEVLKRFSFKEIRLGKLFISVYEYDLIHPFLEQEEEYFTKKLHETFHKPYVLHFEEGTTKPEVPVYSSPLARTETQNLAPEKQQVLDYIKNKLGGVEMRS